MTSIAIVSKHKELSKKQKQKHTIINKTILWNTFDKEINGDKKNSLECIYRACGNREYCDCCNHSLAFSEEGFLTCVNKSCGIIYKDIVDQTAEWRYYGSEDNQNSDPTRCGMPINPLLQESSFGCKVLCIGSTSYEMKKIRRYTEWQYIPYKEKSQYDEFQRITTMSQHAGIPKIIIDDAILYHKKISDSDTSFRGSNRDGVIAASIYIACRINNYPRTSKEISTIFHLDPASATKGCKNAISIINDLEKDTENSEKTNLNQTKPDSFIERYCSKLNINTELTKLCHFIALKIEKNNYMADNTPHSIAAGIVYFVIQICSLNVNRYEVKNVSEISEVTINKCYKKIEKLKHELVPSIILEKYK